MYVHTNYTPYTWHDVAFNKYKSVLGYSEHILQLATAHTYILYIRFCSYGCQAVASQQNTVRKDLAHSVIEPNYSPTIQLCASNIGL